MNYVAIAVAALAMWLLGALWYQALFGKIWVAGIERQGVKLVAPSKQQMVTKLVLNYVINVVLAVVLCVLLDRMGLHGWMSGLKLGAFLGLGVGSTALATAFLWESKPLPVFFVDAGYTTVGMSAMGVILAIWH